jgi:hypothetical protein
LAILKLCALKGKVAMVWEGINKNKISRKKLETEKPLVNRKYMLEKYPGKGGWTYAAIPEVLQDKSSPFGWVKVRGWIDNFEIKNYKLMPMGNGKLFYRLKPRSEKRLLKRRRLG